MQRLLTKLDIIREGLGDDRVYDVIQDVLEGVGMDDIINSVFNGQNTAFDAFLAQDDKQMTLKFETKIKELKEKLSHSVVDYKDARVLKENSDEKRLQPIYIQLFFEKAFGSLGGKYTELRPSIFRIDKLPDALALMLRRDFNIHADSVRQIHFCFDKQVFLDYQNVGDLGKIHYINPGNVVFDSLIAVVRNSYREDMLKGTVMISPDDREPYFAYFVKSQIMDNRPHKADDSIADERLLLVCQANDDEFHITSPAKFIDLHPPTAFAKVVVPPTGQSNENVVAWSFEQITVPQLEDTREHAQRDSERRRAYLLDAFSRIITDLQMEIQEQQGKLLYGDPRASEKIQKKQERLNLLIEKKEKRLEDLRLMSEVAPKAPEVLGCAYVVPLTQVEYQGHYGMTRDDEVEAIAMEVAMNYERSQGWAPEDVSANNEGYDIRSISKDALKRYIEVKGRAGSDGSVMISENEYNRLLQLGEAAWLYIVTHCATGPLLHRLRNPAKNLKFDQKAKGVQFFLPMAEWKSRI